jgi:AraC-like DNA-binding protein
MNTQLLTLPPKKESLGVSGIFNLSEHRASRLQPIRRLPIFRPVLIRVVRGVKRLWRGDQIYDVNPGDMIALPARVEVDLMNTPDALGYQAQVLNIVPEAVERFREKHGPVVKKLLSTKDNADLRLMPGAPLVAAWEHLLELWQPEAPSAEIARHRLEEVLLCLALQGDGHGIFLDRHDAFSERVRIMLQVEPSRKWVTADVAARLNCSEATLRRHLAEEGTSFSDLLDAVRMNTGLSMLFNTSRQIDEIALACGYDSASRFSIRFRQRFGRSPTEMRATR